MRALLTICILWVTALPAVADEVTQRMMAALQSDRLLTILAEEAAQSGQEVDQDFLGGEGGDIFAQTVTRLNDPARLMPRLEALLTEAIPERDREAVTVFFESDLGTQIIDLELSARVAMIEPEMEEAVMERVAQSGVPDLVQQLIEESRLIERNTEDSMEIVRQFFLGLAAGGQSELTPAQIDNLVAESRPGIEADTTEWLGAFLTLSYSPLDDADLETYLEFWRTDAGRAFDEGLFSAFRTILAENSYALGQLVGRLQASEDI